MGRERIFWRRKVCVSAGMSEKSYVTMYIFTTVWLGLNRVYRKNRVKVKVQRSEYKGQCIQQ